MLAVRQMPAGSPKKRLLVVDDDPQILRLLKSFLQQKGYEVHTSPNGWDCIKDVLSVDPDLVILDIRMPKVDGITVLNMLKNGGLKRATPIILLTAMKEEETVLAAGELKTDEYVVKPFDLEDLEHRIASHLYSVDMATIRQELILLEKPDPGFFKGVRLGDPSWMKWRAFPTVREGLQLCYLVNPKLDLANRSLFTDDTLQSMIVVLVKLTSGWKTIWPQS